MAEIKDAEIAEVNKSEEKVASSVTTDLKSELSGKVFWFARNKFINRDFFDHWPMGRGQYVENLTDVIGVDSYGKNFEDAKHDFAFDGKFGSDIAVALANRSTDETKEAFSLLANGFNSRAVLGKLRDMELNQNAVKEHLSTFSGARHNIVEAENWATLAVNESVTTPEEFGLLATAEMLIKNPVMAESWKEVGANTFFDKPNVKNYAAPTIMGHTGLNNYASLIKIDSFDSIIKNIENSAKIKIESSSVVAKDDVKLFKRKFFGSLRVMKNFIKKSANARANALPSAYTMQYSSSSTQGEQLYSIIKAMAGVSIEPFIKETEILCNRGASNLPSSEEFEANKDFIKNASACLIASDLCKMLSNDANKAQMDILSDFFNIEAIQNINALTNQTSTAIMPLIADYHAESINSFAQDFKVSIGDFAKAKGVLAETAANFGGVLYANKVPETTNTLGETTLTAAEFMETSASNANAMDEIFEFVNEPTMGIPGPATSKAKKTKTTADKVKVDEKKDEVLITPPPAPLATEAEEKEKKEEEKKADSEPEKKKSDDEIVPIDRVEEEFSRGFERVFSVTNDVCSTKYQKTDSGYEPIYTVNNKEVRRAEHTNFVVAASLLENKEKISAIPHDLAPAGFVAGDKETDDSYFINGLPCSEHAFYSVVIGKDDYAKSVESALTSGVVKYCNGVYLTNKEFEDFCSNTNCESITYRAPTSEKTEEIVNEESLEPIKEKLDESTESKKAEVEKTETKEEKTAEPIMRIGGVKKEEVKAPTAPEEELTKSLVFGADVVRRTKVNEGYEYSINDKSVNSVDCYTFVTVADKMANKKDIYSLSHAYGKEMDIVKDGEHNHGFAYGVLCSDKARDSFTLSALENGDIKYCNEMFMTSNEFDVYSKYTNTELTTEMPKSISDMFEVKKEGAELPQFDAKVENTEKRITLEPKDMNQTLEAHDIVEFVRARQEERLKEDEAAKARNPKQDYFDDYQNYNNARKTLNRMALGIKDMPYDKNFTGTEKGAIEPLTDDEIAEQIRIIQENASDEILEPVYEPTSAASEFMPADEDEKEASAPVAPEEKKDDEVKFTYKSPVLEPVVITEEMKKKLPKDFYILPGDRTTPLAHRRLADALRKYELEQEKLRNEEAAKAEEETSTDEIDKFGDLKPIYADKDEKPTERKPAPKEPEKKFDDKQKKIDDFDKIAIPDELIGEEVKVVKASTKKPEYYGPMMYVGLPTEGEERAVGCPSKKVKEACTDLVVEILNDISDRQFREGVANVHFAKEAEGNEQIAYQDAARRNSVENSLSSVVSGRLAQTSGSKKGSETEIADETSTYAVVNAVSDEMMAVARGITKRVVEFREHNAKQIGSKFMVSTFNEYMTANGGKDKVKQVLSERVIEPILNRYYYQYESAWTSESEDTSGTCAGAEFESLRKND